MFPSTRLARLIREVQLRPSPVYRDRFSGYSIGSEIDIHTWHHMPFVSRDDIQLIPFWDRVRGRESSVHFTRNTYGTSGSRILVSPRTTFGDYRDPYAEYGLKRLMTFFGSAHHDFPRSVIPDMQVFFGDVGNLPIAAATAAQAHIDSLNTTPYTAIVFAPLLVQYGAIENIKVVRLCGERCSPLQFETIKRLYPKSIVYGYYTSTETREIVALPCTHDRLRGGSLVVQPVEDTYCELVVPETGDVIEQSHVHGELVVTILDPDIPFPLIRYRTGDIAVYTPRECGCDRVQRAFQVLGRMSVFPVRLTKGELTVNATESALAKIPALDRSYFEIHYFEERTAASAAPRISIELLKGDIRLSEESLAKEIAEQLYVYPEYTYAAGVRDNLYLPLTVTFLRDAPVGPLGKPKSPIIVRHVADSLETHSALVG